MTPPLPPESLDAPIIDAAAARVPFPAGQPLLTQHPLIRTSDLGDMLKVMAPATLPHRLSLLEPHGRFDALCNLATLGRSSLHYSRYETPVAIDVETVGAHYLVSHFVSGDFDIDVNGKTHRCSAGHTIVASRDQSVHYTVRTPGCSAVTLIVDAPALEDFLTRHLGMQVKRDIRFAFDPAEGDPALSSLVQFIYWLCVQLDDEQSLLSTGRTVREVEDLILAQLIQMRSHSYSEWVGRETRAPSPGYVKRAEDYMLAHADEDVAMADLCAAAGVSASALFRGFRRFRGTGPMAYLKEVRLERARSELERHEIGETTVTEIATKWRFYHLGRFAADYMRRFGESPSTTLRAARKLPNKR